MRRVISASRRIDMVGSCPDELKRLLVEKAPPGDTHTVVIWTKDGSNIFRDAALLGILKSYGQLYFHYTITGLGGSLLEPRVPGVEDSLVLLRKVAGLAGNPERVALRFDPIVHFRLENGELLTNFNLFESIAAAASRIGIRHVFTSWVSSYGKVVKRLEKSGIATVELTVPEMERQSAVLENKARKCGVELLYCCVPGRKSGKCIDGDRLTRLHPDGEACSSARAGGQRELCGCTESLDIGWYRLCRHGCLYCYGNPDMRNTG